MASTTVLYIQYGLCILRAFSACCKVYLHVDQLDAKLRTLWSGLYEIDIGLLARKNAATTTTTAGIRWRHMAPYKCVLIDRQIDCICLIISGVVCTSSVIKNITTEFFVWFLDKSLKLNGLSNGTSVCRICVTDLLWLNGTSYLRKGER